MTEREYGPMRIEVSVWCGVCSAWEEVGIWSTRANHYRAEAKAKAREHGWSWTRREGWTCPDCKAHFKEA